MSKYYLGSDIPITVMGIDWDIVEDEFEIWFYVYSNKVHKINKTDLVCVGVNAYQGLITREDVATIGIGWVTMEIKLLDVSHNVVEVHIIEGIFEIKNSLIGQ